MIGLRPMPFAECRARWEWMRAGLDACRMKAGERWLPEDIYEPLRVGGASAFAVVRDGGDVGFAVLQRHVDPDGPVLFVWALWVQPGAATREQRELLTEFERLAVRIGAVRIRMESPRKGWETIDFFVPMRTIYEHEVSHGTQAQALEAA